MRWRGGVASLLLVALPPSEPRAQPAPPAKVEGGSRTAPAPEAGTQIPLVVGSAGAGAVTLDVGLLNRGIVVHRSTDAHGVPANGVVVVGEVGLLLFDTGWTEAQTDAILEARAIGFTGDADLVAWPAAVRRISARYGKLTLIPGHGAIDSTGGACQHTLDLLSSALPAKR